MRKNKAFTIIELIVVMVIIIILAALIIPLFQNIRNKALQNNCMANVKSITQAIIIYTADKEGFLEDLPYSSVSSSAEKIFGAIYQKGIWTSLDELKCPSASTDGPDADSYGKPLIINAGSAINYHVVFTGNEVRSNSGALNLNTILSPGQNILIIEDFDQSIWNSSTRHIAGGACGRINGSAEFLLKYPKNKGSANLTRIAKPSA